MFSEYVYVLFRCVVPADKSSYIVGRVDPRKHEATRVNKFGLDKEYSSICTFRDHVWCVTDSIPVADP